MVNYKYIPNHVKMKCWGCDAKGYKSSKKIKCELCNGSGEWIEKHWHLVYIDKKGNKIAFGVDGLK